MLAGAKRIRTEPSRQAVKGAWRIRTAVCALGASFLYVALSGLAGASTPDGWRWPRYDNRAVHVRVVVDVAFDRTLLPQLKDAAKAWSGKDIRLDVDKRAVQSCDTPLEQTICVQSNNLPESCVQARVGGCSWQQVPAVVAADGNRLLTYARAWLNPIYLWAGPNWVRQVFCHELGHDIGLGHTEDGQPPFQPSCMSNDPAFYQAGPSADDLELVRQLYSARDKR